MYFSKYVSVTFFFTLVYLQCHMFTEISFATTIALFGSVSCYYRILFNYGNKAKDVDLTCRCHLSNIMPDSTFYDSMG